MTSSQVHTQHKRIDSPTVRMQPVANTPEPSWPTAEPMSTTDLGPAEDTTGEVAARTPVPPSTAAPVNGAAAPPVSAPEPTDPAPINGVIALPAEPDATLAPITDAITPAGPTAAPQVDGATPQAGPTAAQAPRAAKPTSPVTPRSKLRRIARRIVGPTLLTRKN